MKNVKQRISEKHLFTLDFDLIVEISISILTSLRSALSGDSKDVAASSFLVRQAEAVFESLHLLLFTLTKFVLESSNEESSQYLTESDVVLPLLAPLLLVLDETVVFWSFFRFNTLELSALSALVNKVVSVLIVRNVKFVNEPFLSFIFFFTSLNLVFFICFLFRY